MLLTALVAPEHTHDPQFEYGFLLHDIGELMVADFVRNKPGTLTDAEWAAVRAHPENGRLALEGIDFLAGAGRSCTAIMNAGTATGTREG